MLTTLLLLASGPAWPTPRADTTIHRYRVELSVRSEVDLVALGMPMQIQEQAAVGFLTITLADSAGGKAMLARIDSATFSAGDLPLPPDVAAQAKGTTFIGYLDAAGKLQNLTASSENPVAGMIESLLGDFFPRLPTGEQGPWRDTVNLATSVNGGRMRTEVITEYAAAGSEEFHGEPALKLTAAFTTVMEGTMETPAGEAGMRGAGSGTGNYYISRGRSFLGGSRTTTQQSDISMAMAPAPIPVKTTTVLVVAPIR
ncbi:MAG: hypothetical protein SGI84_01885 [Gemmatimonadota bacterium]|nr:hypothetical protein [Gemmatimonadota bacterium]